MDWYYVDAGRRVGPVAQEQFDALVAGGTVTLSTLVWQDPIDLAEVKVLTFVFSDAERKS